MNLLCVKAFKWLTVFGLIMTTASAAIPEEKAKELDAAIAKDLDKALDKLVDEKEMAELYEFQYPVPPPAMALHEVQDLVEKTLDKMAVEKFPKSILDEGLKAEAHKFELWQPGQKVKGMTKEGKIFEGYLRSVGQTNIQIDARKYLLKDLTSETYTHLSPEESKKLRNLIRKRLVNELIAQRARHKTEIRLDQTRIIYHAQGYIRVQGKWLPKKDFFKDRVAKERQRFSKLLAKDLKYKHYYNGGFRIYKGEWYTPEEVARLRLEDFIKEELKPEQLMAELDILNKEGKEGVVSSGVKNLFDLDDKKKKEDKKEEKKEEEDLGEF